MPSIILTAASGGPFPLVSGNYWSGRGIFPKAGVQMRLAPNASGNCYISLSGGATTNSGGFFLSGVNALDGMVMAPGDSYFVPKSAVGVSGTLGIYATCDAGASGQARLYYEIM